MLEPNVTELPPYTPFAFKVEAIVILPALNKSPPTVIEPPDVVIELLPNKLPPILRVPALIVVALYTTTSSPTVRFVESLIVNAPPERIFPTVPVTVLKLIYPLSLVKTIRSSSSVATLTFVISIPPPAAGELASLAS